MEISPRWLRIKVSLIVCSFKQLYRETQNKTLSVVTSEEMKAGKEGPQ